MITTGVRRLKDTHYTLILLIVVDRMIQYSKIHIVFKYKYRYRLTMDFCAKIKSLHPLSLILSEARIIIINLGRNKGIVSD